MSLNQRVEETHNPGYFHHPPPPLVLVQLPNHVPCPKCIPPYRGPSQNNRRVLINNPAFLLCFCDPDEFNMMIPSCMSGANRILDSRDAMLPPVGREWVRCTHTPTLLAVRVGRRTRLFAVRRAEFSGACGGGLGCGGMLIERRRAPSKKKRNESKTSSCACIA